MVQTVPGNTWIDGGEENVAVAKTIHYTADEVKAGDYIYSGRSTSDGGLRKRYPNGKAQVIADPKPQSVAGKTVAGVVFCIPKDTDPTGRLTPARLTDDKIMMKDFPNAEIWNYIVNPSLVAAGGPTPIYTTSYWSSTEAYYSPNNAYYYSMKTRMASVLVKTAEDIDTHKNDFGISNALRYRITPSLMAKASFGYDVRLPSEEELLGDGYVIAPAGNLTPERNISVNIGMLFDLTGKASSNLQIELNGYYMHLKDMIRFTGGFLQSQYQNFGEMRTLGMEAEVKADMTRWLYGYVNATYQDLRDVRKYEQNTTVANPTKGSRMPNIPYLMANAGLEFHKENLFGGSGMNTRIFTDASFVEEYLYDFEQSQFQQHRIPRALSCNIGFEQSFGNGRYFIMGKINNLTDTKMISEFNRPLPGRSFTIRFRYVFK